jgi:hypothetical protein
MQTSIRKMKDKEELELLQQLELSEHADDIIFFLEDEQEEEVYNHMNKNPFPDVLPGRGTQEEFSSAAEEAGLFCRMIFLIRCRGCELISEEDMKPDF